MEDISSTSGVVLTESTPVVYLLHGDPGTFSLASTSLSKESVIECIGCSMPSSLSMEWHSSPSSPEISPQTAVYFFSEGIAEIKEVRAVTYHVEANVIRIWTFIGARDKSVRRAIYLKELSLMEQFPSLIFDFNVVSSTDFSEPFVAQNLRGHLSFYRRLYGE